MFSTGSRFFKDRLNRSYNAFVFRSCDSCDCAIKNTPTAPNRSPNDVEWNETTFALRIEHLDPASRFRVEWTDALTGTFLGVDEEWTDVLGHLTLEHPKLETRNNLRPIIAFKVYPDFLFRLARPANDSNLIESTQVSIFPNPATNNLTIKIGRKVTLPAHFEIRSVSGTLILSGELLAPEEQIDISLLAEGVYLMYINSSGRRYYQKIIVVHEK